MASKADLIEQAVGKAPAGQLARMNKAQLEALIKGEPKEKEEPQVEKPVVIEDKNDPCNGCRYKGNRHQCGSCLNRS